MRYPYAMVCPASGTVACCLLGLRAYFRVMVPDSEFSVPQRGRRPVALVTGASRGIGRQTALTLAQNGYDIAFTARTVAEGMGRVPPRMGVDRPSVSVAGSLAATRERLQEHGGRALPITMDLLDIGSVRAAVDKVHAAWGPVDLLVNNAIAHLPGEHERLLELDLEVARDMLVANYLHQVALVQAVLPGMLENRGGTIVDMCSGSATTDPPAPPGEGGWGLAYSASKAAFGRMAGAVNAEYRSAGIRAFNVDPGFVVTDAGAARGGTSHISDQGFEPVSEDLAGAVIAWLARTRAADSFLGKVIWAPKLAADLGL